MNTLTPILPAFFMVALALPFLGAFLALSFGSHRFGNALAQSATALAGLAGIIGVALYFLTGAAQSALPLFVSSTIALVVNPLSAFFLGIVYLGILLTSIYSIGSLPRYASIYSLPSLASATAFFLLGMQGTLMAGNLFAFLLLWEAMSLSAYFLVIADAAEDSLAAGFLYFIMTHIGYVALLAGFFVLSGGNVFADWGTIASGAASLSPLAAAIAFVLLFIGFGSKAGLVPLHQWLPYAHPQAPSASSALLSGVMLKVALYGFIMAIGLFAQLPLSLAVLVIVIGLLSALFGVIHAAVEHDAKKLLAWSSVENMGLLFTGVGLFMAARMLPPSAGTYALASGAALFVMLHVLNHSIFKTGLFMAAGTIASLTHTRELDLLGGLARALPALSGIFLVLALGAAALPPFGTFFGEWTLLSTLAAALASLPLMYAAAAGVILAIVALVGGLAIFAFIKLFSSIFLGRERSPQAEHAGKPSVFEVIPPAISALLLVASALVAFPIFAGINLLAGPRVWTDTVSLASGADLNAWQTYLVFALIASAVIGALAVLTQKTKIRITDTWDCGQPLTARMQYTSTGFAAPIRFFFRALVMSKKQLIVTPIVPTNRWIAQRELVWSTASFWESWFYVPLARLVVAAAGQVKRLQSGLIQVYLILLILALIATIIYAL